MVLYNVSYIAIFSAVSLSFVSKTPETYFNFNMRRYFKSFLFLKKDSMNPKKIRSLTNKPSAGAPELMWTWGLVHTIFWEKALKMS